MKLCLSVLLLAPLTAFAAGETDICVYGGTSGGVAAAVQAARMGKRVVILEPGKHLGGMTAGGLSAVDIGDPGKDGEPAPGVQAYCFRLCLTTNANRIAIAPPPDYDPKRYEVVVRFIAGCLAIGDDMDLRWFSKHDPLPNGKWDFNTATFGGNLPGASWEWPEASYARREQIAKEHENYHRGLLHFLATDPRVPEKVRNEMRRFGLPRDEFTNNGGWPHQLYIREARRMVSDFVMTEHHTFGRKVAPNSVGLGSYGTDTHEIRRIVKLIHDSGHPYLQHSCGRIFPVMDEWIAAGINAKHSNEDAIGPYDEWIERYGDRIGLFGGIDTDRLCRMKPDDVYAFVLEEGTRFRAKAKGYVLGSGNSIPNYVPVDGYLAMIRAAQEIRRRESEKTP
jgi:hypothetical protein